MASTVSRGGRAATTVFLAWLAVSAGVRQANRAVAPAHLSDQEFWAVVTDMSEPNGYFRSDNLVSDEAVFAGVVPDLLGRPKTGSAYLGVGPEQNFSYIAALEPKIAFVLDIRRGNLELQLLYKALFELSADRAEFVSRLFVKPRPAGLQASASARELMAAYWNAPTSAKPVYQDHLAAVTDVLVRRHGLALSADDLRGIEYVYYNFYWFGPSITWQSSVSGPSGGGGLPTFADLIRQVDGANRELSFLATESRFAFVKTLEANNAVVPVVGNFAGPKALRAIGQYLRGHDTGVAAFYVSEVEPYLLQDGIWPQFCANVATLPIDEGAVLIRPPLSSFGRPGAEARVSPNLRAAFSATYPQLAPIADEVRSCR